MEQPLLLKVYKERIFGLDFSFKDRAILLSWTAETEVWNVLWAHLITIKLAWPPIHSWTGFIPPDQD